MLLMIRLLVFKSSQVKIHESYLVPKIFSTIAWHVNNYIVHLFLEEKLLEHIFARKSENNDYQVVGRGGKLALTDVFNQHEFYGKLHYSCKFY